MKKSLLALLCVPPFAFAYNSDLDIDDVTFEQCDNRYGVLSGSAKNISGRTLTYVVIEYGLYKDGVKVQKAPAAVKQLKPDEQWQFESIVVKPFDHYELQSVRYQ